MAYLTAAEEKRIYGPGLTPEEIKAWEIKDAAEKKIAKAAASKILAAGRRGEKPERAPGMFDEINRESAMSEILAIVKMISVSDYSGAKMAAVELGRRRIIAPDVVEAVKLERPSAVKALLIALRDEFAPSEPNAEFDLAMELLAGWDTPAKAERYGWENQNRRAASAAGR